MGTPTHRAGLGFALVALVALLPACQPEIGDPCRVSRDCSIRGERQCDLSNAPQSRSGEAGECTIENCSFGSCPDEAVCIKTYGSDFLTVACDPALEDVWTTCTGEAPMPNGLGGNEETCICDNAELEGSERDGCAGSRVPNDDCMPNETCLPEGLCADEISARTSCRRECRSNRDCRPAYRCQRVGNNGVYVSPKPKNPTKVLSAKICVPRED